MNILEFLAQDFTRADLISLAALGIAGIAAIYARRQSEEARKSRLSAEKEARRPQRLEVFREMEAFCRYCGSYYTLYLQGTVPGTRNLVARTNDFKEKMDQAAISDMPRIRALSGELATMGWAMQRHLDRLGNQCTVVNRGTDNIADQEAVQALVDKFEAKRLELDEAFSAYLHSNNEA